MNSYEAQLFNKSINRLLFIANYELLCMAKVMVSQNFRKSTIVDCSGFTNTRRLVSCQIERLV